MLYEQALGGEPDIRFVQRCHELRVGIFAQSQPRWPGIFFRNNAPNPASIFAAGKFQMLLDARRY